MSGPRGGADLGNKCRHLEAHAQLAEEALVRAPEGAHGRPRLRARPLRRRLERRQQLLRPERGGRVEGGGLLGRERRLLELELGALIMNHEPLRMSEGRLLGSSHLAPWYDRPRER